MFLKSYLLMHNLYSLKFTLYRYTHFIGKCIQSCNHHHNQGIEYFHHPSKFLHAPLCWISNPSHSPGSHSSAFCPHCFAITKVLRKWNGIDHIAFCIFCEVNPCVAWIWSSFFKLLILICCMYVSEFVYL